MADSSLGTDRIDDTLIPFGGQNCFMDAGSVFYLGELCSIPELCSVDDELMGHILQVTELRKTYGKKVAVDSVSFGIHQGEMMAMLGPNGAGKSTIVSILSTFMHADSGKVLIDGMVLGRDNRRIRKKIGVVFQKGVLDEMLTVEENISIRAGLYGLKGKKLCKQVMETCRMAELEDLLKQPYGELSGGQQRRCDIARALVHRPKLLFLDEPAAGLDPEIRTSIWRTIHEIRRQTGMTVFLTTHYMDEAEMADRIIIMKKGRIAAEGTPEELRQRFADDSLRLLKEKDRLMTYMLEKAYLSIVGQER